MTDIEQKIRDRAYHSPSRARAAVTVDAIDVPDPWWEPLGPKAPDGGAGT